MQDSKHKEDFINKARVHNGDRILDVGCGTGSLTRLLKKRHPFAEVVGVDGDPDILKRAHRAAEREQVEIHYQQGLATQLPFKDREFKYVFSSLMLHHLRREEKLTALNEMRRVLASDGTLNILDWGRSSGILTRLGFLSVQLLDGFETTRDHALGFLPALITQAGFRQVAILESRNTIYGTLNFIQAEV